MASLTVTIVKALRLGMASPGPQDSHPQGTPGPQNPWAPGVGWCFSNLAGEAKKLAGGLGQAEPGQGHLPPLCFWLTE